MEVVNLGELSQKYRFNLKDVEEIYIEEPFHLNRTRLMPLPNLLNYDPLQQINTDKFPYIFIIFKNGKIMDIRIDCYVRITRGV